MTLKALKTWTCPSDDAPLLIQSVYERRDGSLHEITVACCEDDCGFATDDPDVVRDVIAEAERSAERSEKEARDEALREERRATFDARRDARMAARIATQEANARVKSRLFVHFGTLWYDEHRRRTEYGRNASRRFLHDAGALASCDDPGPVGCDRDPISTGRVPA